MKKLQAPKVFKSAFDHFTDERGYLNPISSRVVTDLLGQDTFKPVFQLTSLSTEKHTFRGLHYQCDPFRQTKLLIVHSGQLIDYIVPFEDPSLGKMQRFELCAGDVMLIPNSFAHGFLTKTENVLLQYLLDEEFDDESYRGISASNIPELRENERKIRISEKDQAYSETLRP